MKIKEIMHAQVVTVELGSLAKDAFEIIRDKGFRHLPVVDETGKVQGILSDRDIRNITVILDRDSQRSEDYLIPSTASVDDIMVRVPVTGTPEQDVLWAVEQMKDHGFSCLPILEGEKLVGIVTDSDLLGVLAGLLRASPSPR